MSRTLTYALEIAVGIACLGAATGARGRQPWVAAVLLIAGLAAVLHGIVALTA